MNIKVLYFGMIAEICKESESNNLVEIGSTSNDIKNGLLHQYPAIQDMAFSMAINQNMVTENVDLKEGDEIAFFPPFAGG